MENRRKNHATLHRALRLSHALPLWSLAVDALLPGMYTIVFRSAKQTLYTSLLLAAIVVDVNFVSPAPW